MDGTPGADDMPGRLVFATILDGASSVTERFRITSSGVKQVSNGNLNINSTYIDFSGDVSAPTTAAAIFRPADNTLAFSTANTERLRIDSSGRLLVTGGNTTTTVSGFRTNLQVAGTGADSASIMSGRFGNNASAPFFIFHKSRNASFNGNTIVQDDDILGRFAWYGADGTDYEEAAHIQCQVDGTPSDGTDMPGRLIFATTPDGDHNATERLRITSGGAVQIPVNAVLVTSGRLQLGVSQQLSIFQDSANAYLANDDFIISNGAVSETLARFRNGGAVELHHNNSKKFETTTSGVTVTGAVSDSIGDLRSIPMNTQSSSASYTLQASDAGKTVHVHTTTTTVVVPNSVFSAGDAVSIVNGDGSNTPTISQGSGFSLRNTGDGSSGSRTLGVFGMATIYFTGAGVGYISGSGMT